MASDDPVIQVTLDGETIDVDLFDIDGNEWATVKKQLKLKPRQVFEDAQDFDFEALAALVWIMKRRDDPQVGYDEILSGLSMRSLVDDTDDDDAEEVDERPSDSGAGSEG